MKEFPPATDIAKIISVLYLQVREQRQFVLFTVSEIRLLVHYYSLFCSFLTLYNGPDRRKELVSQKQIP